MIERKSVASIAVPMKPRRDDDTPPPAAPGHTMSKYRKLLYFHAKRAAIYSQYLQYLNEQEWRSAQREARDLAREMGVAA